ncbi:MAG: tRNA (adenosine(37)-N6)-dimethylallyltransferase MiaA, partial [Sphingomonas sp.]
MNTSVPSDLPVVAVLAGPTASGKSAIALALAERLGGTVINADASQVYADLRVVSARPSPDDEARAPHRLFGHVDGADAGYSAARWAGEAKQAIAQAHATGRLPILVGGTGLYLRTLIDGIAPVPDIDPAIRAETRAMAVRDAYAALVQFDPAHAATLNPADTTRVARALEVVRSTGRSIAAWRADRVGGIADRVRIVATVLLPPRNWLDARIAARVDAMLKNGAIEEVRALLARPDIAPQAPILRAIGVREISAMIAGMASADQTAAAITLATHQYAKRQFTWFRNQPPSAWARYHSTDSVECLNEIEIRL